MLCSSLEFNALQKLIRDTEGLNRQRNLIYYKDCPGKRYATWCQSEFNQASWTQGDIDFNFDIIRNEFVNRITSKFNYEPSIRIQSSPFVSVQVTQIESNPHLFIANFNGLKSDEIAIQVPERNIIITFPYRENVKINFLPYLGSKKVLKARVLNAGLSCTLPPVEKGAVVWID